MARILGFGEKLRKLRNQKHMRQEDVAKALDISLRAYSRYECQDIMPHDPQVIVRMAELFGVDKSFLMIFSPATVDNGMFYRPLDTSDAAGKAQTLARDALMQLEILFEGGMLGKEFEDEIAMAFNQVYFRIKMREHKKNKEQSEIDNATREDAKTE